MKVPASNDLMALCGEERSFLDHDLFRSTFGDTLPLVKPYPRCKVVRGNGMFDAPCKVVGMIP